jgi:pentatricopeptide repeat protein
MMLFSSCQRYINTQVCNKQRMIIMHPLLFSHSHSMSMSMSTLLKTHGKRKPRAVREMPKKELTGPELAQSILMPSSSSSQVMSMPRTSKGNQTNDSNNKEDDQEEPSSSFKSKYNLKKIRFLNGEEKVDLLRQFMTTNHIYESIYIYDFIQSNPLLAPRLKHHDYHTLFHLLLSNPSDASAQTTLKGIFSKVSKPTPSMIKEYIACLKKWRDVESAKRLWKKMKEDGEVSLLSLESCTHLLQLFMSPPSSSNTASDANHTLHNNDAIAEPECALEVWTLLYTEFLALASSTTTSLIDTATSLSTPKPRQSSSISNNALSKVRASHYILGLSLYGKLQRVNDVLNLYKDSLSALPQLRQNLAETTLSRSRALGKPLCIPLLLISISYV